MLSSLFYRGSIEVMDGRSLMYRDSPQGLWMMDYYNRVQGFINFTTSIPINFTGGGIRCPCRKCQNKKYLHPVVVMMRITCVDMHTENYLFVIRAWEKGWLGQLLVLATCMELQMTTAILIGIWLWMQ